MEAMSDRFPAESALLDLAPDGETDDALVIVARFAALRIALLAAGRSLEGGALHAERDAALAYAATVRGVAESRVLGAIARTAGPERDAHNLPRLLAAAGSAAERQGHVHGAFGLFHAAWALGKATGALGEAARAARGIAELAARLDAPRSARLWTRRSRALDRRAAAAKPA